MSAWQAGHPELPRLLAGLERGAGAMTLDVHLEIHGPLPDIAPHKLIEEVEQSGLRGRRPVRRRRRHGRRG